MIPGPEWYQEPTQRWLDGDAYEEPAPLDLRSTEEIIQALRDSMAALKEAHK